jgi:hypothetical protein
MTASIHSSSSKKSTSSKSNHPVVTAAPDAPASAAPVSESTSVSPTPVNASPQDPAPSTPSNTIATNAIAQLDALEASLGLDIVVPPNDKAQIRALNRVSDTALGLASDIVSSDPSRFAFFSAIPTAVNHVKTMTPVAARAAELGVHLQKSVQNARTPAAQQTLALYAVVKGLGRITDNETMREKVPQLKAELVPKRKDPKPKETKAEKAAKKASKSQGKRLQKAMAVIAAAGGSVSTTTPPVATPAAPSGAPPAPVAQPAEAAPVATSAPSSAAPAAPATH